MKLNLVKKIMYKCNYSEIVNISDPNKKIFYIIRRKEPGAGFFSNYFYVLSHIKYAMRKGFECVVDMENYHTLYSEKKKILGTQNSWEYYFSQPNNNKLDIAYKSQNYILSRNKYLGDQGVPVFQINQGHITTEMAKDLFEIQNRVIPIKDEILDCAETWYQNNVKGLPCIGVHMRGTDMKTVRIGHTLPPSIDRIVLEIDKILKKEGNALIFLSSDEEDSLELMKKRYGHRLIYLNVYRSALNSTKGIHTQKAIRLNHNYLLGREVLMDSLMLSKCDYLICGISNVTSAAVMFANGSFREEIILRN